MSFPSRRLRYLATQSEVQEALTMDLATGHFPRVIGFDMEWKPRVSKKAPNVDSRVAVIQLASSTTVYVIHLSRLATFPKILLEILENPNIVKAGVGIQGDVSKLYSDWSCSVTSCVDLSLLARCVDFLFFRGGISHQVRSINSETVHPPIDLAPIRCFPGNYKQAIGLSRLLQFSYGIPLQKGNVTTSDWSCYPLTEDQMEYAARDAQASLLVFEALHEDLHQLSAFALDLPKQKYYQFDGIGKYLFAPPDGDTRTLISDIRAPAEPMSEHDRLYYTAGIGDHRQGSKGLRLWRAENPEYEPN